VQPNHHVHARELTSLFSRLHSPVSSNLSQLGLGLIRGRKAVVESLTLFMGSATFVIRE